MPKPTSIESVIPDGQCSRSEFQAQRDKLESLLRDAGREAMLGGKATSEDRHRTGMTLEHRSSIAYRALSSELKASCQRRCWFATSAKSP